MRIRRIFIFDAPDYEGDPSFVRVRRLQREAGVEIRGLDESQVPERLKDHIVDFIVFDDILGYETTRASRITHTVQPAIVTTRIVLDQQRVERSRERFEELWEAAKPLPDDGGGLGVRTPDAGPVPPSGSSPVPPSGGVAEPAAGEDVPDPVKRVDR